eukprot:TRINITY_DN2968_c0_g1_i1.p1 TRINITY_DN2968_c0_g1~~TRINITY_DN2968_c0_g1_i1.p1  ORF type:complete len:485 (+),score=67.23 TRINITY_DN2968_c0_g1_i1:534-1988(+)
MELLVYSHYLGIEQLSSLSAKMLADYREDISSFEGFPPDLIKKVLQHLNPLELCSIQRYMSLDYPFLDSIWENHYNDRSSKYSRNTTILRSTWERHTDIGIDTNEHLEYFGWVQKNRNDYISMYLEQILAFHTVNTNLHSKTPVIFRYIEDVAHFVKKVVLRNNISHIYTPEAFANFFKNSVTCLKTDLPSETIINSVRINEFDRINELTISTKLNKQSLDTILSSIRKEELQELSLISCSIDDGMIEPLLNHLKSSSCKIEKLSLYNNQIKDPGLILLLQACQNLPTLTLLEIGTIKTTLTSALCNRISNALENCTMQRLLLDFVPSDVSQFGSLTFPKTITSVTISGLHHMQDIVPSLFQNTNLKYLDISSNKIFGEINFPTHNQSHLEYLNISSNLLTSIDFEGLFTFSPNLKYLNFSGNRLNETEILKILTLENIENQLIRVLYDDNRFDTNLEYIELIKIRLIEMGIDVYHGINVSVPV